MRRLATTAFLLLFAASAGGAPEPRLSAGYIRLAHMTDGLRSAAPKRDLRKLPETSIYKEARKAGLDLRDPPHALIAYQYENGRLFYVFYKFLEGIVSDRPYAIQRIKKTVRNWTSAEEPPEEIVSYQVETFKTIAGALKRPDQHYGSYGLRTMHKREIVKEYEIGIGEIPGDAEGLTWPYESRILYKLNQPYQADIGIYDDVRFTQALTWSLTVAFDRAGYRIQAPELGIDIPKGLPDESRGIPRPDKASKMVSLEAGRAAGKALEDAAEADVPALGKTVRVDRFDNGTANHALTTDLTVHVGRDGKLKSIVTHAPFAGKTAKGIRHGSHRTDVMQAHGVPKNQMADAWRWRYPGIQFTFDGYHRVVRIGISKLP